MAHLKEGVTWPLHIKRHPFERRSSTVFPNAQSVSLIRAFVLLVLHRGSCLQMNMKVYLLIVEF